MKDFILLFTLLFFISSNSQINNIAEKLGYDTDAKLLIIHGDDIGAVSYTHLTLPTTNSV